MTMRTRADRWSRRSDVDPGPPPPALAAILKAHPQQPDRLLPVLQDIQVTMGHIPAKVLPHVAQYLGVPESRIYAVTQFYDLFTTEPEGKVIHLCDDVACYLAGSPAVRTAVEDALGAGPEQMSADKAFTLKLSSCLGGCHRGPGMLLDNTPLFDLTPDTARQAIAQARYKTPMPLPLGGIRTPAERRVMLSNCEVIDPESLDDYLAHGGFQALKKALDMGR